MKNKSLILVILTGFILFLTSYLVFRINVSQVSILHPHKEPSYATLYKKNNYKKVKNKHYVYSIDNISVNDNSKGKKNLIVDGWIIKKNVKINKESISVAIKKSSNSYYILPTEVISRADVTKKLNDKNNYNYSGFSTNMTIPSKMKTGNSNIYILININGKTDLIKTNYTI